MIEDAVSFYSQAHEATEHFDAFVAKHHLTSKAIVDHLGFKCASAEEFVAMRAIVEGASVYVHQSIISGRRSVYAKLRQGIATSLGEVFFLELSDQKPDGSQKSGFDHIEVYPAGEGTYESILATLKKNDEQVVHVERPHHITDEVTLPSGLVFRLEPGPLIEKIKQQL